MTKSKNSHAPHSISFKNSPSQTRPEFAADADINTIMDRWMARGTQPVVNPNVAFYGDFSDGADFQSAMNRIIEANEAFASLTPADLGALAVTLDDCDGLGDDETVDSLMITLEAEAMTTGLISEHLAYHIVHDLNRSL